LIEGSTPSGGWTSEEAKFKAISDDKHGFIRSVLGNLYVFNCMDSTEFNMTIRSLANFFKTHKSIGMVAIDGLHFIEDMTYLEKRAWGGEDRREKATTTGNIQALAEELGDDIPSIDEFFGDAPSQK
jgi:hypothetical protein